VAGVALQLDLVMSVGRLSRQKHRTRFGLAEQRIRKRRYGDTGEREPQTLGTEASQERHQKKYTLMT
jgi:hypothetical protein